MNRWPLALGLTLVSLVNASSIFCANPPAQPPRRSTQTMAKSVPIKPVSSTLALQAKQAVDGLKQGNTLTTQARPAEAIPILKLAIQRINSPVLAAYPRMKENLGLGWWLLGQNYLQLSQTEQAVNAYQKALTTLSASGNPAIRSQLCANLGRIYMMDNQLDKAKPLLEEAIRLGHEDKPSLQRYLDSLNTPDRTGNDFLAHLNKPYQLWDASHRNLKVAILHGGKPEYTQQIQQAFQSWQQKLDGLFTFTYVTDPQTADVQIIWTDKPNPQIQGHLANDFASGYNHIRRTEKVVTSNDIYLSLTNLKGEAPEQEDMYNTILHEIGHMLGMSGHSPSPGDVMVAVSPRGHVRRALTDRDVATVKALYQQAQALPSGEVVWTPADVSLVRYGQYEQLLAQAQDQLQRKQLPQAEALANQAQQLYVNHPLAPLMLSNIYIRQGLHAKAKQVLTPWVNQSHAYTRPMQANFLTAQISETFDLAQQGQWATAQPRAEKALENITVLLRQPDLDAPMRDYLVKARQPLQAIVSRQSAVVLGQGMPEPDKSRMADKTAQKKPWWQGSGYTNKVPVYLPMPRH